MTKIIFTLLVLSLPACGMQGDLYLPDDPAAKEQNAAVSAQGRPLLAGYSRIHQRFSKNV